jgi:hypothetical protein
MIQANTGSLPTDQATWLELRKSFEDESYVMSNVFDPFDEYLGLISVFKERRDEEIPPALAQNLLDRLQLHLMNSYHDDEAPRIPTRRQPK